MGLAISVGVLTDLIKNDPEGIEFFESQIVTANALLATENLPQHNEPTVLPQLKSRAGLDSFPYSFIHYLRAAFAHVLQDPSWRATPLDDDEDPTDDPAVEEESSMFTSHLLCHSDCEGFYVPIDFSEVIFSDDDHELPGGMLGSSVRLHAELIQVAPALGISLSANGELADAEAARINALGESDEGLYRELTSWIALYEASRISIEHRTAIVFS
jgi:hypothetical protein